MKANEAPEKIQVHFIKNDYGDWSVRGYSLLEDKQIGMTEYTRTDAFAAIFIEKAEGWLREVQKGFILTDKDIVDFVDCMKGE